MLEKSDFGPLEVFMGWHNGIVRDLDPARRLAPADAWTDPPQGLGAPDHPLVRAILNAVMAAGPDALDNGWRLDAHGALNTQRVGAGQVSLRLEAASPAEAEATVRSVSPLILDVLPLLLDCGAPGGSPEVRVLRATQVLHAKGSHRWGDERRALIVRLAETFQVLRRLALPAGPLLFDLTPLGEAQEAFVYQPADWLRRAALTAPRRHVDPRLLHLDHRANRGPDLLAKKLGLYFSLFATEGGTSVRSVAAVLKAIGAGGAELASRRSRGGRLAERFDEALLRLAEQELFLVRYRGGAAPSDDDDRVKGWVSRWLASDLVISRAPGASARVPDRQRVGARIT